MLQLQFSWRALEKAGWWDAKHDGRGVRLGGLIPVDEGLIFTWCRSVSFLNVRRNGSLEQIRREKKASIKIRLVYLALITNTF